jgi:hypothetical protein
LIVCSVVLPSTAHDLSVILRRAMGDSHFAQFEPDH